MAQTLASLPNEALVKDNATTYNGVPIIWRKAATDHTGYPANSVTLITDKVISLKSFDGQERDNADNDRSWSGNNRYRTSNIRQWLNSQANPPWFVAQNLTDGAANTNNQDAPPSTVNVSFNAYDNEKGFMANFSASFRNAVLPTTLHVARNTVTDNGGFETVTDHVFLASNTEVRLPNENSIAEGVPLPIFTDDMQRRAAPTPQVVINDESGSVTTDTAFCNWWLRTPNAANSFQPRLVHTSGALFFASARANNIGIRPLCNLKSDILVSDEPDADGAFVLMLVKSPTAPPDLNAPSPILSGTNPVISWGMSIDQNNPPQAIIYILERSTNSGNWTAVFTGIARTFTDSVAAGVSTVQYRVRARNTSGLYSDNQTSNIITVVNNSPPVIDGADAYLGEKNGTFTFNYTVTDPDAGAVITVREYLNGVLLREFTAANGAAQTLEITTEQFIRLPNATEQDPHSLLIHAADEWSASDERLLTFSRNETQIDIMKNEPHPANIRPARAAVTVDRRIPQGAAFQVLICNNGFDASPAWEDCTNSVLAGAIYEFQNQAATAYTWGVNVRVLVNRNQAEGLCYIGSIGGNFE